MSLALAIQTPGRLNFPWENNSTGETPVSVSKSSTLSEAIADALRRRVGQGRTYTVKQFCQDMRVSEQTYWQWLSGNRAPKGQYVVAMLNYFDASFPREIGIKAEVVKLNDARYQAAVKLNRAVEEWKATA